MIRVGIQEALFAFYTNNTISQGRLLYGFCVQMKEHGSFMVVIEDEIQVDTIYLGDKMVF